MTQGLRYGTQQGGRYVARDRLVHGQLHPEHATWHENTVVWTRHRQGGHMCTFDGPDEVYREITRGGLELWRR